MGWSQQGYNAQGFNPSLGFGSPYWYVGCNGEDNSNVEAFHETRVDIGEWATKLKIVYGTSSQEYFRGYILTPAMETALLVLSRFDNFLVYEGKYGGEKAFKATEMVMVPFLGIILFFEARARRYLGDLISFKELEKELLEELNFGIRHGFISNEEKSQADIALGLQTALSHAIIKKPTL